jgi:hypothetical protein
VCSSDLESRYDAAKNRISDLLHAFRTNEERQGQR